MALQRKVDYKNSSLPQCSYSNNRRNTHRNEQQR